MSIQSRFNFNDDNSIHLVKESIVNPLKYDTYIPSDNIEVNIEYGDIYQLGNHRLMCGDSTNHHDITKLMNNEKADITFTSPPYNTHNTDVHIGFHHPSKVLSDKSYYNNNQSVYLNNKDNLTHEEYGDFLCLILKYGLEFSDDVLLNIGVLAGSKVGISKLLYEYRYNFCDILIWEKDTCLPLGLPSQKPMVSHRGEFIYCFNPTGNRKFTHSQWDKGTKDNIINSKGNTLNRFSKVHNAVFPLGFAIEIVKDFCECSVLDLFGGVGTTLIASEFLKRKCYIMEIDPLYCQIIINRWEHYTNKKAEKKVEG